MNGPLRASVTCSSQERDVLKALYETRVEARLMEQVRFAHHVYAGLIICR